MQTRLRLGAGAVLVPDDWEGAATDVTGDIVLAREPVRPGEPEQFRANAVLVREDLGDLDFSAWQTAVDEVMPSMLADYVLVDLEHLQVAGRPGGRRLAHHVEPGGRAVVMEQWFTCTHGTGYTVTTTVDVHRFDALAPLLTSIGTSLRIADDPA